MDDDAANEVQINSGEGYISPLGTMAVETHELYLELKKAGFPDAMIAQILANMLTDAVYYGGEYEVAVIVDDDDDLDDDEDGLENGTDS